MLINNRSPKNIEAICNKILIALSVTIILVICYMCVDNSLSPERNGLALTPLMGWTSRKRLLSKFDGDQNEEELTTSEKIIKYAAEVLHKEGYSEAGYKYIIIDDSWTSPNRDKNGELVPNQKLFPNGIHDLAKHVHKLDLKLGITGDIGTETCQGHPGSWGNYDRDAETFSKWEIDLLQVRSCFATDTMLEKGYRRFEEALTKTGRHIIYSIDWPLHDHHVNFTEVVRISNLWRVYHDVHNSFESVMSVIDFVCVHPNIFQKYSGPGSWADLDVLAVGGSRLSIGQSKLQMAMWSIFPAPLLLTNNLKHIKKEFKDILINSDVIAVNQDSLGLPGVRMHLQDNLEVWVRKISPIKVNGDSKSYSFALVIMNRELYGKATNFTFTPKEYGMNHEGGYEMKELFHRFMNEEHVTPNSSVAVSVESSSVVFLRFKLSSTKQAVRRRIYFGSDSYFTYNSQDNKEVALFLFIVFIVSSIISIMCCCCLYLIRMERAKFTPLTANY